MGTKIEIVRGITTIYTADEDIISEWKQFAKENPGLVAIKKEEWYTVIQTPTECVDIDPKAPTES